MFKKRMANQDSWCSPYTTRSSPTQYHPNEVILCLPLTHTASRPNRAPQISSCRRKTRSVNFTHHPHPNCSYPITNLPVRPVPGPKSTSELGIFLHCIAKRLHQPSTPMAGKRPFRERENMLSDLTGKPENHRLKSAVLWDALVSRWKKGIHIVLVVSPTAGWFPFCR